MKGADNMNVFIIDTERQNSNRYQIMSGGNGMFEHLYPAKLFTLEQATTICKENNYHIVKIGTMWQCVSK